MKRHLTLALLAMAVSTAALATVRTVSNNANSPGQFTDMNSVMTASSAGDTILVHGSSNDYGSFTLTKQLVIIGTGHNPQKQAPLVSFSNGTITFASGSSNSKIIGFKANQILIGATGITGVSILLCQITDKINLTGSSNNGWVVDGNVFTSTTYSIQSNGNTNSNWQIRNNIFNGYIYYLTASAGNFNYINNNVFLRSGNAHEYVTNAQFNNNVFYRANAAGFSPNNVFYNRNLLAPASNTTNLNNPPGSANNVSGVASSNVFVTDLGTGANFAYATNYELVGGSVGENYGTDGTDVGVYGGLGDYNQNGIPRNPYISEFTIANPSISNGGTLNINFKSKIR